jgi:hypothetical protein
MERMEPFYIWLNLLSAFFAGIVITVSSIHAERTPEYLLQQNLGACLNPLGMLLDSRLLFRIPLSQDTGILFKTSRFEIGIINEWSPADDRFGVCLNYEPLAVFNIWCKGGIYENYRLFGYGYRRLATKNAGYHDTIVAELPQHNRTGTVFTFAPSLKMKAGPVVFADNFTCNRIDIFNEDGYFYEIRTALPHATHDYDISNDVLLLYELNRKWLVGLNYNLLYVNKTEIRQQKMGGMVIFSTSNRKFHSIFGLITSGVYLESQLRNHTMYIAALTGFELRIKALQ